MWNLETRTNNRLPKNLIKLQEKALQIINFKNFNENVNPLFKENQILKVSNFIAYKNELSVRNYSKEKSFLFNDMFTVLNTTHEYITRAESKNLLDTPNQSTLYGESSLSAKATSNWDLLQRITNASLLT